MPLSAGPKTDTKLEAVTRLGPVTSNGLRQVNDRMLLPVGEDSQEDSAIRLDGGLERIEWDAQDVPDSDDCGGEDELG